MFKGTPKKSDYDKDFSKALRETGFYRFGRLKELGVAGDVSALAVDPVGSWMAVGTSAGSIHILGAQGVSIILSVYHSPPSPIFKGNLSIRFLLFHPAQSKLIAIDSGSTVHVWDLSSINPVTKLPHKEGTNSLYGTVTAVDVPNPGLGHIFCCMKDGNTICVDVQRGAIIAPYKIPNVWAAHEERQRRTGLDPKLRMGPVMATAIAANPRDLNVLLLGYEGGCVLWDVQKAVALRTFELIIPPGAPGGGTYEDETLFTERAPNVTCLCWRPDALAFAVGYDDGCIAIWSPEDSDKPLSVRTVALEDVNVTDAESLFDSGALDRTPPTDLPGEGLVIRDIVRREPIFKLSWSAFPDPASLAALLGAQGTEAAGEPVTNATRDFAENGETVLTVLGGLIPTDPQGITILQFPAYTPPTANIRPPASPGGSGSMSSAVRTAFRDSLSISGSSLYPTAVPCEEFILVPRSSPFFSLNFDPVAIVLLLVPDPSLPPTNGPRSSRAVQAFSFPPSRADNKPLSPGRKEFITPGNEVAHVPMSVAPKSPSLLTTPSLASPMANPRSPASPWFGFASGPSPSSPLPPAVAPKLGVLGFGTYELPAPAAFWGGADSVLGCEVYVLPTSTSFRKLVSWSIEKLGREDRPRLPLRGGSAYPDFESPGAPDLRTAKLDPHRVLATFDRGAKVRFYDISPHLLVLPTPLRFDSPSPLNHLTVDVRALLRHPSLSHLPVAKLLAKTPQLFVISSIHLSTDSLELAICLESGQVLLYKFGAARAGWEPDNEGDAGYFPAAEGQLNDGKVAEELTSLSHLAKWGTDGFKPVWILDARRGQVISCAVSDAGFVALSFSMKSIGVVDNRGPDVMFREGFGEEGEKAKGGESSAAPSLKWTVSGLGSDPTPGLRLIVGYQKGLHKIWTCVHGLAGWMMEKKAVTYTHEGLLDPIASFVLDANTGEELTTSPERLDAAMKASDALQRSHAGHGSSKESKGSSGPPHSVWIAVSKRSIRAQLQITGERIGKVDLDEDIHVVFLVCRHGNKVLVALTTAGTAFVYSVPSLELVLRLPVQTPVGRVSMDTASGDYVEFFSPVHIELRTLFDFRKPQSPNTVLVTRLPVIPPQPLPVQSSVLASWLGSWGGGTLVASQVDAILGGPKRPAPLAKPVFAPPKAHTPPVAVKETPRSPVTSTTPSYTARKPADRERRDVYSEMASAAEERGGILDGLSETMGRMGNQASEMAANAQRIAAKESAKASARSFFRF